MHFSKLIASVALLAAGVIALADGGNIRLTTLPSMTVADGRSTITISAYVTQTNGKAVPDGTQVIFTTTLGNFKEDSIIRTVNGIARCVLVAGGIPGTATVTATTHGYNAVTTTEIEFVSDRSLLSSAKEFIEVVAPGYMMYNVNERVLAAAGPGRKVQLRYRDISIDADDLQFNIDASEVRAKKAHLKFGKVDQDFDELYMKLSSRRGSGMTTVNPKLPITGTFVGTMPYFETTQAKVGRVRIDASGTELATDQYYATTFAFQSLSDSTSMISSKKAVVFPHKEIQFQKAEILVQGTKILKMPLYEFSLTDSSPIVTDKIFSVNDSQININYPYYLTMKPGQTSLLRFTTGNKYGRTSSVDRGMSLSYEMAWNRGDEFDGGVTLSDIGRTNWALSARQYMRFDRKSYLTAFAEVPGGKNVYGSVDYNRQLNNGFGVNLDATTSNSLSGARYNNQQLGFSLSKDAVRLGSLPVRWSYGLNANTSNSSTSVASRSQSTVGLNVRTTLMPQRLDKQSSLNASFSIGEQAGRNVRQGLTMNGNANLSRRFGKFGDAMLSYEFMDNGFNSGLTGRHQLSLFTNLRAGRLTTSLSAMRGLDSDRLNLFADLGFRLSSAWRLSYFYTLDRYFGNTYVDYTAALGYRIGFREIGLTYSNRTKKLGIAILGSAGN